MLFSKTPQIGQGFDELLAWIKPHFLVKKIKD